MWRTAIHTIPMRSRCALRFIELATLSVVLIACPRKDVLDGGAAIFRPQASAECPLLEAVFWAAQRSNSEVGKTRSDAGVPLVAVSFGPTGWAGRSCATAVFVDSLSLGDPMIRVHDQDAGVIRFSIERPPPSLRPGNIWDDPTQGEARLVGSDWQVSIGDPAPSSNFGGLGAPLDGGP